MKIRYYIADDVRQELNNKVSLAGLYADNCIVVNFIDKEAAEKEFLANGAYAIERLMFMINISEFSDELEFKAQFSDPENHVHGDKMDLGKIKIPKNQSYNFIIQALPFTFKLPGIYKLNFYVNDKKHELPFEIRME